MNKFVLSICVVCLLFACKAKKAVTEQVITKEISVGEITLQKLIAHQSGIKQDFKTAVILSDLQYEGKGMSQQLSAEIRLKKDEIIHINIRFFGISMAKALITPQEVKYYEKMGGTYFEGNYDTLSNWMGTPLNFQIIQNIILGKTIDDLQVGKYTFAKTEQTAVVQTSVTDAFVKTFEFTNPDLVLKKQIVNQPSKGRMVQIDYNDYVNKVDDTPLIIPQKISIKANQVNDSHTIELQHSSIKLNEEITFPYTIPDGYERIYAK